MQYPDWVDRQTLWLSGSKRNSYQLADSLQLLLAYEWKYSLLETAIYTNIHFLVNVGLNELLKTIASLKKD